jgi:hypothetical protein
MKRRMERRQRCALWVGFPAGLLGVHLVQRGASCSDLRVQGCGFLGGCKIRHYDDQFITLGAGYLLGAPAS